MRNLFKTSFAVSFVALAACGSGGGDDAIVRMGTIADELCGCTDMACAKKVLVKMNEMSGPMDSRKMSKAAQAKASKLAERMATCQQNLVEAAPPMPSVPPPAEPVVAPGTGSTSAAPPAGTP